MGYSIIVGHPYPVRDIADGQTKALYEQTEECFNLACYLQQPSEEEIRRWNAGPLHYGIHYDPAVPGIPLLAFNFDNLIVFDTAVNLHNTRDPQEALHWLNSPDGNASFFFLIDAETNIVRSMRALGLSLQFMEQLRSGLREQLVGYADRHAVDRAAAALFDRVSSRQLLQKATFYAAGDPSGAPVPA